MKTQITEHKDQNIFSCRFWELITSSAMGEIVENQVSSAYVEFIEALQHQTDNNGDYKYVFRILADLEAMLSIHVAKKNRMGDTKKNVELLHYTKLAHRRVKAEQHLLERRINHPELFVSYAHKSELYWGDKFVKRCLLELISALYYIGAVVDKYGKPIEFRPLVRGFESMLNIDLEYLTLSAHKVGTVC